MTMTSSFKYAVVDIRVEVSTTNELRLSSNDVATATVTLTNLNVASGYIDALPLPAAIADANFDINAVFIDTATVDSASLVKIATLTLTSGDLYAGLNAAASLTLTFDMSVRFR